MIVTETFELDGIAMVKTYSSTNHYIERDGVQYTEAIDPASTERTYTESDDEIEIVFADELEETKAALAVLGVSNE